MTRPKVNPNNRTGRMPLEAWTARETLRASGNQRCCRCGVIQPLSEFVRSKRTTSGAGSSCRACENARRQKKNRTPIQQRADERAQFEANIRSSYGISVEDWARLFHLQRGLCAVCGDVLIHDRQRGVNVDHCHRTGRIRGLLCHYCNKAAGLVRDRPAIAAALAAYLRNTSDGSWRAT